MHQHYIAGDSLLFSQQLLPEDKNVELCSLSLPPFSPSTFICSWFDECLLHLFLPLPRLTQKSFHVLYMEGLGLASWLPGSFPCSLALLQNQLIFFWQCTLTCILISHSLLPGNGESRNDSGHSQKNIQNSQEWIDPWLLQTVCTSQRFENGLHVESCSEGQMPLPRH